MKKLFCVIALVSLVLCAGCGSKKATDPAEGKKLMTKFCQIYFETD